MNYKLVVVLKLWKSRFLNPSKLKTHPKTWNLAWFHDMAHICHGKKNRRVWEEAHTLVANEVLFEKTNTLILQTVVLYLPCRNLTILDGVRAAVWLDGTSARSPPCSFEGTRASSPPCRLDGTHTSCPPRRLDGTRASREAAHAHREASSLTFMHQPPPASLTTYPLMG